ncbi:MAG: MFS transporter [Acidilobaceae archaeon]|nr:MFS transporter [Acidilobaceae archaeon]MCX8165206.1 MFS transporter [Acidilobaceae archaeon]MDW7974278.1 MFS transporter [Sulfolobales archaeon]
MKLYVFLLLSLVSLLADMTYEGGRSVSGPYLEALGAALLTAGGLSLGEMISYAFRSLGGFIAQRGGSRGYWSILLLGYATNLAIPALAFAPSWEAAFGLYLVERAGKGLRTPVRDAILAEVSAGMGRGKAFALHELLDQMGAILGPLAVALLLPRGYGVALLSLSLPALLSLLLVLLAWRSYPRLESARPAPSSPAKGLLPLYLSMALAMFSFAHWGQASYLLNELGAERVAMLYAIAMTVDALSSLPLGIALDRLGLRVLPLLPVLTLLSTLTLLYASPLAFVLLWGTAMAAIEVLPRAALAVLTRPEERGSAYSLLYFYMGLGWASGNIASAAFPQMAPYFLLLSALLSFGGLLLYTKRI